MRFSLEERRARTVPRGDAVAADRLDCEHWRTQSPSKTAHVEEQRRRRLSTISAGTMAGLMLWHRLNGSLAHEGLLRRRF